MGKDTYLIFEVEGTTETSTAGDWKNSYDPRRWEDVKIEFAVPPLERTNEKKLSERRNSRTTYPETERRKGGKRRTGTDRRVGSSDRRSWQDSRWIGAPDCRSGQSDRRQGGDRRVNPDRRRK